MGMTMSHMAHIVDPVQIGLPILGEKILSPTPDDFQGFFIGNTQISSQFGAADGQNVCLAASDQEESSFAEYPESGSDPDKVVPDIPLRRPGHTGEIAGFTQHVQDDLEVKMRRPAAVGRRFSDPGEGLPLGNRHPDRQIFQRIQAQVPVQGIKPLHRPRFDVRE